MNKKISKSQLFKQIQQVDKTITKKSPEYLPAMVLLSSLVCGPYKSRIAKFLGVEEKAIDIYCLRARTNGIFVKGEISCEWFEKSGGAAFIADIAVLNGLLKRVAVKK